MALAKIGSHQTWTVLCRQLDLPETHANRIGTYLRYTQTRGTWPAIHAALDDLITLLQHQPPPIDYQQRRTIGKDTQLLAAAVDTALRRHPTRQDRLTLTRLLWEKFTGSDIAYAPELLHLDPGTPAHTIFRRLQPVRYADLLHSAHRHLQHTHTGVNGPLSWMPTALPRKGARLGVATRWLSHRISAMTTVTATHPSWR